MQTRFEREITRRVIAARKELGLEPQDVAKALNLEAPSYRHYERGRTPFTVEQLFHLSRILGRPVEWFLGLPKELSEEDARMLHLWRQLPTAAARRFVLHLLEARLEEERAPRGNQ